MRRNPYKWLAAALLALLLAGCTSDEEKINRIIDAELEECKAAEGPFYEVKLFDDSKVEILKSACELEVGEIERIDEFKARTTTGPYTWLFGIDEQTDVWVLSGVSWDAFDRGRRDIENPDATPDVLKTGIELFSEAQDEWAGSAWIQEKKLEAALRLRETNRTKAKSPTELGATTADILKETRERADEIGEPELAARAEMMTVDYFKDYRDKLISAMDNFGGQDEWLENLIAQAKKDKNKEDEKKYTEELEKVRAERPAQKQEVRRKIYEVTKNMCDHLANVDGGGEEIQSRVEAIKNQVDCSPEGLEELKGQIEASGEAVE